jgi:hypothetical protein
MGRKFLPLFSELWTIALRLLYSWSWRQPRFFMMREPGASALRLDSNQEPVGFRRAYLAGLGASPGFL